jgi:hypothetical protein
MTKNMPLGIYSPVQQLLKTGTEEVYFTRSIFFIEVNDPAVSR